jgi:hypothetical protein
MSEENNAPETLPAGEERTIRDWADLGEEVWSFLTGRHAMINYAFDNMTVEVPRDIGPDAPRAIWKFDGSIRVTTSDIHNKNEIS